MSTPTFAEDLAMLRQITNSSFAVGADLVRKTDVDLWFRHLELDPEPKVDWDAIQSALQHWERAGYIEMLTDIRTCKYKDYCFKTLQIIPAIPESPDTR